MVTTNRSAASWYLDPRAVRRPEPGSGETSACRGFRPRFADVAGQNSFAPWLDAELVPDADGLGGRGKLPGRSRGGAVTTREQGG
jgi:hypothetical protein